MNSNAAENLEVSDSNPSDSSDSPRWKRFTRGRAVTQLTRYEREFLSRVEDTLEPSQFPSRVNNSYTDEQRLILAVLETAIIDYAREKAGVWIPQVKDNKARATPRDKPNYDYNNYSACLWFSDLDDQTPFSFGWCCNALRLDADDFRARLEKENPWTLVSKLGTYRRIGAGQSWSDS